MSAKWLLHHKPCSSRLEDMASGTFFQRLIVEGGRGDNMGGVTGAKRAGMGSIQRGGDEAIGVGGGEPGPASSPQGVAALVAPEKMRRIVFCSGKVHLIDSVVQCLCSFSVVNAAVIGVLLALR